MKATTALVVLMLAVLHAAMLPAAQPPPPPVTALPPDVARTVAQLRAAALADDNGYAIVEDLVTRIGARMGGSPEEARARAWASDMFRQQGFSNIRVETFPVVLWQAPVEQVAIVEPGQQALEAVAIGGSPSTPAGGITAPVQRFGTLDELQASTASLAGRIAFIDEPMARTQDFSGYSAAVRRRSGCSQAASRLGALACVIRSVGTNDDRFAHQGNGGRPGSVALPTLAVSPPDADTLSRLIARSATPVRLRLALEARVTPNAESGNVLAEVVGRENPTEIVLAAAHLDSWSGAPGAVDDGAGVAIITAAAKLIQSLPVKPRRTIRLLLAGSEETGGFGGTDYGARHGNERHIVAAESDAGAGRVWQLSTGFGAGALPHARALAAQLAPLAINPGSTSLPPGDGGTDINAITTAGVPVLLLHQDLTRYFDIHHTANDTLERIDRDELRQNIAAWAVTLYLIAEMGWDLRAAN
jgi:carboxypeptidase Q